MKGDFSRIRFNPGRQYTAVLNQQGRVALDADVNEQCSINQYLRSTEIIDAIGEFGAPIHDAGFAISVVDGQLQISAGRYYVEGLMCENAQAALSYDNQPYLIGGSPSEELLQDLLEAGADASLRVYLEAWQRLVTALDDPCLGEPALGQADTTARAQTVWRVVAELDTPSSTSGIGGVSGKGRFNTCCPDMYRLLSPLHDGSLSAQTAGGGDACGCQPVPAAGYIGLENQLYRVEVHRPGDLSSATFKWTRENGCVVVAIQSVAADKVTVASLGPDANLGFQQGQWVEITDDSNLFGEPPNQPGMLYQIQHIDAPSLTVTLSSTVQPVNPAMNARMRRWDQFGSLAGAAGVALSADWLTLENGIQVRFAAGTYFAGDAWTIPARSATGNIDWPPCGGNGKAFQPPHYARVYRAPLACIHPNTTRSFQSAAGAGIGHALNRYTIDDCRRLFWPLTELTPPAPPSALHVTNISWANDDVMTLDVLMQQGLTVTFDQAPNGPMSAANFVVSLETPEVLGRDVEQTFTPAQTLAGSNAVATKSAHAKTTRAAKAKVSNKTLAPALQKIIIPSAVFRPTPTVLRSQTIIDSLLTADADTLLWTLPFREISSQQDIDLLAINAAMLPGAQQGWPSRVRVKLIGRTIYNAPSTSSVTTANNAVAANNNGATLYLDGQTFGQSAQSADGSRTRVDLQLPSGNQDKASDFESWFYLYPILTITALSVTYPALIAVDNGNAVNVLPSPLPAPPFKPVTQEVTVTLNYAPATAATLNLTLTGDGSIASVPSSVAVTAGQSSVSVPVSFIGVPPAGAVQTLTVSASVSNALGFTSAQSTSFTVSVRPGA
jgi:hypothetical protein